MALDRKFASRERVTFGTFCCVPRFDPLSPTRAEEPFGVSTPV